MNKDGPVHSTRVRKWGKKVMSYAKRLPPNFGEIDPNSPFDVPHFFKALAATGHTTHVLYEIGTDKVGTEMRFPISQTKLQRKRFANLVAWERNMDPKRSQQSAYVRTLVKSLTFAAAKDGDSKYFYYPLA
jgi:hypothetical protein